MKDIKVVAVHSQLTDTSLYSAYSILRTLPSILYILPRILYTLYISSTYSSKYPYT